MAKPYARHALINAQVEEVRVPLAAVKGRGVSCRHAHRFEADARAAFDDGWGALDVTTGSVAEGARKLATEVSWETARSAITRNQSPDIGFNYGLNPYRGCEHGCSYCYARPTHSYLGLSPGLDFETRLVAKQNIASVLAAELQRPSYVPDMVALGTVTDAYQPVERDLRLTRSVIEVFHQSSHPVGIVTKGSGVERDLDLLAPMAEKNLCAVYVTITTLDAQLARILEPRAAAPHRRLRTIRALAEAGVPVGVSVSPQIPFINDDMEHVLQAAAEAGASRAFYQVLRLPWELAPIFRQWLQQHYPDRAERVMARIQDMRGGQDYDADFNTRMKGSGIWSELLRQRFHKACSRLGLGVRQSQTRTEMSVAQFNPRALSRQAQLF